MSAALVRSVARVSRVALRPFASSVRTFAKKADKDAAMSNAELTKAFLEMDAVAASAVTSDLPMKLTGRSGALVESLYNATSKTKGGFDKVVKDVEAIVAAVEGSGLVVDRFFTTTNYSPEECKLVAELLLTTKEPLTSFEGIKNADTKELIVDNEGNMDTWRNVRKAIAAVNASDDVKRVVETLGAEGRLDLVKVVARKAAELRAVTSKAVEVTVASAVALSKDQQAAIAKALPPYAPTGATLNINYVVDPATLGGLLISLQNKIVDLSASSKLVDVVAASQGQRLA